MKFNMVEVPFWRLRTGASNEERELFDLLGRWRWAWLVLRVKVRVWLYEVRGYSVKARLSGARRWGRDDVATECGEGAETAASGQPTRRAGP